MEFVDHELSQRRFKSECSAAYLAAIRGFVLEHIVQKLGEVRRSRGMFDAMEREAEWDADTDLSMGASDADKAIVDNKSKVTEDQLKTFLNICWTKYVKAKIEPGMRR